MSSRSAFASRTPHLAGALLATTILAGIAAPAHAQSTIDWNGSQSSDWQNAANWDQNRVPATNDLISIQNDVNTSSVSTQDGDNAVYRVLVGSQAGANAQLYVNGSLFFAGGGATAPDIIGAGGGTGRVDVRGFWRSAGLMIGVGGGVPSKGTLVIQGVNGGTAKLEAAYISLGVGSGSTGSLAISGSSALTGGVAAGIDGGTGNISLTDHSGWQASYINLINGSALVSTASVLDTGDVRVGYTGGTGSLFIRSGSVVNAQKLAVGGFSDGANNSSGTGTLEVSGSATLTTSGAATIGSGAGSSAAVSINLSRWASGGGLVLGTLGGSGSIGIGNHAELTDATSILIGNGTGSSGLVTVDGTSIFGTDGRFTIGAKGGSGDVTYSNASTGSAGARLAVGGTGDLDIATNAYLPTNGTGILRLTNGSSFTATPSAFGELNTVGAGAGSTGAIDMSASVLALGEDTFVGVFTGSGIIRATTASIASFDRLTLGSGIGSQGLLAFDASDGTVNEAFTVGYGGALGQAQLANRTSFYVGGALNLGVSGGSGLLEVSGGSVLTGTGAVTVASGTGGAGELEVEGAATGWQQTGRILVGTLGGIGQVDLTSGASGLLDLAGTSLTLGDSGGQGVLRVDGAGSNLTQSNGSMVLGATGGTGGLTARSGGVFVGAGAFSAGVGAGSTGTLAAVGTQSSVTITGAFSFGSDGGAGYVIARDGGLVDIGAANSTVLFGQGAGSTAGFNVDGGGKLNLRGSVLVGGATGEANAFGSIGGAGSQLSTVNGTFELTNGKIEVADGGVLFTGQGASIGGNGTSPALLRLSGAGTSWITAGDTYIGGQLNAAGIAVTAGTGSVYLLGGASLGGENARLSVASLGGIGTLMIDMDSRASAGTYTQGAGGTLVIGIDPTTAGRAGFLSSDGNSFTLANGTHISLLKQVVGQYTLGARYEVIRSINAPITRGTVNFDGLEQQSLFVGLVPTFQALGQGEALYLDVAQTRSFASVAKSPNQIATAAAADGIANASAIKTAILAVQTEDEARGAFDALSGELYPGIHTALIEDSRIPRLAVLDRLTEAQGGAGAWIQGIGHWGETGGNGNAATARRDTKGVIVGLDVPLGESGLRSGVAGGYADGDLSVAARASHADLTSYHALAYLGGSLGRVQLRLGAGYTWSKADAARSVVFPGFTDSLRGRFDARTLQGFGEVGYRLPLGTGWVEPFAGYSAVRVRTDGFVESGGAAALTVDRSGQTATASTLGLKGSTAMAGPIVAGFTIGWQHRFDDLVPVSTMRLAGSAPFSIAGVPLAKDQAVADVAIGWRIAPRMVVSARYSGAIGAKTVDSAVKATLSVAF
jgi:outer membrane autotransporter protein